MLNWLKPQPKTLFIVRGLPGNGKTTLAKRLTRHQVAADDFPNLYSDGKYNIELQAQSHNWCFLKVKRWMSRGVRAIAVHNTFVELRYVQPYLDIASKYGYNVQVVHCEGVILKEGDRLRRTEGDRTKTIHNVPSQAIESMRARWQQF